MNTLKYSSQYSYVVKSCVTVIYIETFPSKRAAPYSNPDHWNSKNRAHLQSEEDTDPEFYNPTQTLVFSALNSKSISSFIHSYSLKVSHREKHFFIFWIKKKKIKHSIFRFLFRYLNHNEYFFFKFVFVPPLQVHNNGLSITPTSKSIGFQWNLITPPQNSLSIVHRLFEANYKPLVTFLAWLNTGPQLNPLILNPITEKPTNSGLHRQIFI